MKDPRPRRQQVLGLLYELKQEQSSWVSHWRDINAVLAPRTGKFLVSDTNRGERKHANSIIDNAGTLASGVLSAGMMAGLSSPARPWFRLQTPDSELNESFRVKRWLQEVNRRMLVVFSRGNIYRTLHSMYDELGLYGTAASFVLPDYEDVIRGYSMTVGEYYLAVDARGEPCALVREYKMTVAQLVKEFSADRVSDNVRQLFETHRGMHTWIDVLHVVERRELYDVSSPLSTEMPWSSEYWEVGTREDKPLRESGFKRFPALVPRWVVKSNNIYGDSPGMVALGDVRQLQQEQLRKSQGIDFQTQPPLQVPSTLKDAGVSRLPGGLTYIDGVGDKGRIQSLYDVRLDLQYLTADIVDVRQRISRAFYEDLFMMLANDTRSNVTAREIAERHEEKLLMLGPVLERLQNEMLSPLIDMTFDHMEAAGLLPEPPEELQGVDLSVDFVSVLAQAQRMVGVGSVDRLLTTVGSMAQLKPEVLDKIDFDQAVDIYADMLGADPNIVVPDEQVAALREARAKQMQAQAAAAQVEQMVGAAKTLSETNTQEPSALTDVMGALQGYGGTPALS